MFNVLGAYVYKSLLANDAYPYICILSGSVADFASPDDEMSIGLLSWVKLIVGLILCQNDYARFPSITLECY